MKRYQYKMITINVLIFFIVCSFPVGYFYDLIPAKIAFPMTFIGLAFQLLFNAYNQKNSKFLRLFSILLGIVYLSFSIFVVIPNYYFK